ncbi:uncharacterized protein SPPG_09248 [Spizellomyces punctatus DAOM BR117]|uniref:F-box domain-containing protein n=1 Tax=Spizellomyces punctatus (strain DAOM BR117) TaxID=645134 RepID=A0A0L0HF07_SPIPD|nr:uncharacterized protein SPPG_09248 [Spizellomyces punctatus DAOM BR117]KNC99682.1 hypothetical protein SPPG_09248 [Spizellomyces punctatus DAOM BR117]|eukprot:XP_016607722.1 hypothetical protein SPPG_09248 [Spizellomyces punctatus DAOM BR117]
MSCCKMKSLPPTPLPTLGCSLVSLPLELQIPIFAFLELEALANLSATCKTLHTLISECEHIWRSVCRARWRDLDHFLPEDGQGWRKLYVRRMHRDREITTGRIRIGELRRRVRAGEAQLYHNKMVVSGSIRGTVLKAHLRGGSDGPCTTATVAEPAAGISVLYRGAINCLQVHRGIIATGWENYTTLTSRQSDGTIKIYDLESLRPLTVLSCTGMSAVTALRFNSRRLVAGDKSGVLRSWTLAPRGEGGSLEKVMWPQFRRPSGSMARNGSDADTMILDVQFTSTHAISRTKDALHVYNIQTGTPIQILPTSRSTRPTATHITPTHLAMGGSDFGLRVYSLRTGLRRTAVLPHDSQITCVQFAPENGIMVSGDDRGMVRAWEIGSWTCIGRYAVGGSVGAVEIRGLGNGGGKPGEYVIIVVGVDGKVQVCGNEGFVRLAEAEVESMEYALNKLNSAIPCMSVAG